MKKQLASLFRLVVILAVLAGLLNAPALAAQDNRPLPAELLTVTVTYDSTDVPKAIPDNTPAGVDSIITVPGGIVSDVNVRLGSLTHTYDGHLDIYLDAPDGSRVELSTDNGSGGDNYTTTTLDDEATASITTGVAPFSGSFKPEGLLSSLDGKSAAGVWKLHVADDSASEIGTLMAWSLILTLQIPPVGITPESQDGATCQGNSVEYMLTVQNKASVPALINMQVTAEWPTELTPASFTLDANANQAVLVNVDVPLYAFDGDVDVAAITATSDYDPTSPAQAVIATHAGSAWLPEGSSHLPTKWPAFNVDYYEEMFYLGGLSATGNTTDNFQAYLPGAGWIDLPAAPLAAYGGVAGSWNDISDLLLYYAPGFQNGLVGTDAFYYFSINQYAWIPLPDLPAPRGLGGGGVTSDGKFILAGGSPNAGFLSDTHVFIYSGGAAGSWSTGATLPGVGFTAPGYVMVDDMLYMGGSYFGSSMFYVYDVSANTWTRLADLPTGAGKVSPLLIAVNGSEIYLVGGGATPNQPQASTWRYNISANTWSEFAPLGQAVLGSGGGFAADQIYTYGGGGGSGAFSPAPHETAQPDCAPVSSAALSGVVTNGLSGAPIEGALVQAVGAGYPLLSVADHSLSASQITAAPAGAGTTPWAITDASGQYELTLYAPAYYDVTASFGSFDPVTANVLVAQPGPTRQDFALGPPGLSLTPDYFDVTLPWGETLAQELTLSNNGYSLLEYELLEINSAVVQPIEMQSQVSALPNSEPPAAAALQSLASEAVFAAEGEIQAPTADVNLVYDDGSQENSLVLRDANTVTEFHTVLFNRFDRSHVSSFPFTLEQIDIHQDTSQLVGEDIQLLVYADPDGGNPTNAVLLHSEIVQVQSENGWNSYPLALPVPFYNPADILVGFSTFYADGGVPWPSGARYPYPMDETDPDSSSYIAWMTTPADPVDPSDLTSFANFTEIGAIGYPADWMIRGYGSLGITGSDIAWLTTDPITGVIPAQASEFIQLTFDAGVLADYGVYTGTLLAQSNDPILASIAIPISLTIEANPDASKLQGVITTNRPGGPLQGAVVNLESANGWLASLETDALGYYEKLIPTAEVGPFTVTISSAGYFTSEEIVNISAPGPVVHDVEMVYTGPEILVSPALFEATVTWGETISDQLYIINLGESDLNYDIELDPLLYEDFEGGFPPTGWTRRSNKGCAWESTAASGYTNLTGGSGYAAEANSNECGSGMDAELWSPPLDFSSLTGATLIFNSDFNDYLNLDDGYVDISTDGGESWTNLLHYEKTDFRGPRQETLDLTPYTGSVNVILRFHYVAAGWDFWWQVDDVGVYAAGSWITWLPDSGALPALDTQPVTITLDSTRVTSPGDYVDHLRVAHDDLLTPQVVVPVTLHVDPNPLQAYLHGTVLGNRTSGGDNLPLADARVRLWDGAPSGAPEYTVLTDSSGFFEKYLLPSAAGTYQVEISHPGYITSTVEVAIPAGGDVQHDVTLVLDGANLAAAPEDISATLNWAGSVTLPLTISNPAPATQDLLVNLAELSGSYSLPEAVQVSVPLPAHATTTAAVTNAAALATAAPVSVDSSPQVVIDELALGKIKVLIVSADWSAVGNIGGLDAILSVYPDLQVDIYPMLAEPTLAELLEYHVVIVGNLFTWEDSFDHNLLGDTFAAYVDAGGKVIQLFGTMHGAPNGDWYWSLGGRWQAEHYSPMTYSTYDVLFQARSLGAYQASHPLMDGITHIHDYFIYGGDVGFQAGAQAVAYYDNGVPYLAAWPGEVVAINQLLTNGADWSGDVPRLLHNALLYLFAGQVSWLSESVVSFDLGIGAEAVTQVTLNANVPEVTQPGDYTAWLWLENNDPLQTGAYIPVTMTVEVDADMAKLSGTITLDRHASGEHVPAAGAEVLVDYNHTTLELSTNESGYFAYYFDASLLPLEVEVTASLAGYQSKTLVETLQSGTASDASMELNLLAPWIQLSPTSLGVSLMPGETAETLLTLDNLGADDLTFYWLEFPPTATLPTLAGSAPGLPEITLDLEPLEIEQAVLDELAADGDADFYVKFRQSANLSSQPAGLPNWADWNSRGQYTYNSLTRLAEQAQRSVRAYLDSRGLEYTVFWINNSLFVQDGDAQAVQDLAAFPEVRLIRAERYWALEGYSTLGTTVKLPPLQGPPALDSAVQFTGTAWGLEFIHATEAWETYGFKGEGIVVGNIDTGVQWDHPALIEQYRGWDGLSAEHNYNWFAPTDAARAACEDAANQPCDWGGHGTHTMGTMVGDDHLVGDEGHRTGVAPEASFMACMGCDTPPNECSNAALAACAQWFLAPTNLQDENPDPSKRPHVLNNSWGSAPDDPWFQSYVQAWVASGIYPAFSSGNTGPGCSTVSSPGDYPESFASGAVDSLGNIASFSSRGPGDFPSAPVKPDLVAPGVGICSTVINDAYDCTYNGTSMASPHTAGAVALLWDANPGLIGDVYKTHELLRLSADPSVPSQGTCGAPGEELVPNYTYGYGYLDVKAAMQQAVIYDIPWLTLEPITGTVAPLDSAAINVLFDASLLPGGTYTGTLRVLHNDPLTGWVDVEVVLNVFDDYRLFLPLLMR